MKGFGVPRGFFAVAVTSLGVAQTALALARAEWSPALRAATGWSGLCFAMAGQAYGDAGPSLFGKRADGTIPFPRLVVWLPYFLATWALYGVWAFIQSRLRAAKWNEVTPGLVLGRRLNRAGSLPAGTGLVVDLTAEFFEPSAIRRAARYRCVPAPDGHIPEPSAFVDAVREVAGFADRVYVHCAQGHGRAALFAAAVLLARGQAESPEAAVKALQVARPGVRLSPAQRALLNRFAAGEL